MSEITDILKKYNIRADKSLSQNFLADGFVIRKIIEGAQLDEKTAVIEIGGGVGALTKELLNVSGRVVAIELDSRLCDVLIGEYGCGKLTVINADILKTDVGRLVADAANEGYTVKVCANLPYHITTPVIMRLLETVEGIKGMTLMMQKEVAERVLAIPGSKAYGAITPAINYRADTSLLANVPPNCFIPRPSVYSSVVNFSILSEKRVFPKDEALMLEVIRAAFGQRRKTLANALSNQLLPRIGLNKNELLECFNDERVLALGILPSARGETLGLMEFAALSDAVLDRVGSRRQ